MAILYFRNMYNPWHWLRYSTRTARCKIAILKLIEIFLFTKCTVQNHGQTLDRILIDYYATRSPAIFFYRSCRAHCIVTLFYFLADRFLLALGFLFSLFAPEVFLPWPSVSLCNGLESFRSWSFCLRQLIFAKAISSSLARPPRLSSSPESGRYSSTMDFLASSWTCFETIGTLVTKDDLHQTQKID